MGYRELLKAYMDHVVVFEGIDFVSGDDERPSYFTEEQWAELRKLADKTEMDSLRIFIGYDPRQPVAYNVLQHSIITRASKVVSIHPLILKTLPIERRGLTEFTYSRFLVPWLCGFRGWALYLDADMLCLGDVAELFAFADPSKAIFVRKSKMRFEWSSVMLFNCGHYVNEHFKPEYVDSESCNPHSFNWCNEELVGELPQEWNQLVLYDEPIDPVELYHFTCGIPLFPEVRGCEGTDLWYQELKVAGASVSWEDLLGDSVHTKVVEQFQESRDEQARDRDLPRSL